MKFRTPAPCAAAAANALADNSVWAALLALGAGYNLGSAVLGRMLRRGFVREARSYRREYSLIRRLRRAHREATDSAFEAMNRALANKLVFEVVRTGREGRPN